MTLLSSYVTHKNDNSSVLLASQGHRHGGHTKKSRSKSKENTLNELYIFKMYRKCKPASATSCCGRAETVAPHAKRGLWRLVLRVQMAEM